MNFQDIPYALMIVEDLFFNKNESMGTTCKVEGNQKLPTFAENNFTL